MIERNTKLDEVLEAGIDLDQQAISLFDLISRDQIDPQYTGDVIALASKQIDMLVGGDYDPSQKYEAVRNLTKLRNDISTLDQKGEVTKEDTSGDSGKPNYRVIDDNVNVFTGKPKEEISNTIQEKKAANS